MGRARRDQRDAKRKHLQTMFDQHKGSEERNHSSFSDLNGKGQQQPIYSSYQNSPQHDIEGGAAEADGSSSSGHVVWMGNQENGYQHGRLLREQAQSLIHMVEDQVERPNSSSAVILHKIQDNPRSFVGTILVFFLLLWWL